MATISQPSEFPLSFWCFFRLVFRCNGGDHGTSTAMCEMSEVPFLLDAHINDEILMAS